MARERVRPRSGNAQRHGRDRCAGQVPRQPRLRRAAEESIRHLPDAVQRHRNQRPDAAWHVAGADRGWKQRHEHRRQHVSARGLDPERSAARPYVSTTTNSTMGSLLVPTAAQIALVNAASAADARCFTTSTSPRSARDSTPASNYSFNPTLDLDGRILRPSTRTA